MQEKLHVLNLLWCFLLLVKGLLNPDNRELEELDLQGEKLSLTFINKQI